MGQTHPSQPDIGNIEIFVCLLLSRSVRFRWLSSGTLFYDYVTCNMYAIVFTALPILLYGTYDRDISAETCLR